MTVKLLTEQNLEFLSLTGGCTGSSEPTFVKKPHCWKAYVTAGSNCLLLSFRNIMGPVHEIWVLIAGAQMPLISVHADVSIKARFYHLGIVTRRPVFGVSDKERFKPVSSATEIS